MNDRSVHPHSGHFSRAVRVTASVEWGYEPKEVVMDAHTFNRVSQGQPAILASRYMSEGVAFIARWAFNCPEIGQLQVFFSPEDDEAAAEEALGFDGRIDEALFAIDGMEYDFGKGFRQYRTSEGEGA